MKICGSSYCSGVVSGTVSTVLTAPLHNKVSESVGGSLVGTRLAPLEVPIVDDPSLLDPFLGGILVVECRAEEKNIIMTLSWWEEGTL